ncbi:C40 family peptidase [Sporolactobacillus pectinivorans]|uniref:C40 family peptidase n=1 Tax=Sporolactobacillus pectinivorans TaxID=1591408 RepID=UPI000C2633C4|nr:LysM peptidoglycan-binding domain-containing protein [Sporolactobacillus pectinivorans]
MKKSILSMALAGGLVIAGTGSLHQAKADSLPNPADIAKQGIGEAYTWGANDCSGFTMKVFAQLGIALPHSAAAQAGYGTYVSRQDLQPGDLVFFHTYGTGITHVGIYVGNNRMISSENENTGVIETQIFGGGGESSYWSPRYVTARRLTSDSVPQANQVVASPVSMKASAPAAQSNQAQSSESTTSQPTTAPTTTNQTSQSAAKPSVQPAKTASVSAETNAPSAPSAKAKRGTYIVQTGDTLWAISRDNGITVSQIEKLNQLSTSMIFPGQKLNLQQTQSYSIKKGDTLWAIARANGISVSQLIKANHLSSTMIYPNDMLTIPQQ